MALKKALHRINFVIFKNVKLSKWRSNRYLSCNFSKKEIREIPDDFAVFQLFCYTRLLVADRLSLLTNARHGPASAILRNVNKHK